MLKGLIKINDSGISFIEMIVVIAIASLAMVSLLGFGAFSLRAFTNMRMESQANIMAHEAIEATRNFRDTTTWDTDGIGTLATNTPYQLILQITPATTTWTMATGTEAIGQFVRWVVIRNVSRDGVSDEIESTYNPVNDDPNSRQIEAIVTWLDKSISLATFVTNWRFQE